MALYRDLRLGRCLLVSLTDQVGESVGDELTLDESGVAIARRRPRKFSFTVPIYGHSSDPDPYAAGNRLRRQIRAMMENGSYRDGSYYIAFAPDPELNGWMIIGSGELRYDQGGVSLARYVLELDSAFRVGNQRSHRPARRLELYDRVSSSVAHDYRGNVFGTDFASLRPAGAGTGPYFLGGQPLYLPVGATDPLASAAFNYNRAPQTLYTRLGIDGPTPFLTGLTHANVASYEQRENDQGKGDVVIFDRQGTGGEPAPAFTNLVTNPSFEIDLTGWGDNGFTNVGATRTRDTTQFVSGVASMKVVSTATPTNQGASILMPGTYLAGVTYTASFYVRGNAGGETVGWLLGDTGGDYSYQANQIITSGWVRKTFSWTPTASRTNVVLMVRNDIAATQTFFVDAVQVTQSSAAVAYFDGDTPGFRWDGVAGASSSSGPWMLANLVTNPSFEVDLTGWSPSAFSLNAGATLTRVTSQAYSGQASGQVVTTAAAAFQGVSVACTGSSFLQGVQYVASVWLKGNAGGEQVQLVLGSTTDDNGPGTNVTLTTSWQRVTSSWTPTATRDGATHGVAVRTQNAQALTWFVDAVQVERASTASPYFDGDTAGASWVGTRGSSMSVTLTPTVGQDVQAFTGWEEVYGPDQPLTPGDAVVLQNGHCRVRYVAAYTAWAIDVAVPGHGWSEQGRVTIWDSNTLSTYNQHTIPMPQNNGAYVTVMEFTPERCVVRFSSSRSLNDTRTDTYITLQRGWMGPRFESYFTEIGVPLMGGRLFFTPNYTTAPVVTVAGSTTPGAQDDATFAPGDAPSYVQLSTEGFMYVQPVASSAAAYGVVLSTSQQAAWASLNQNAAAYGGGVRQGYGVAARYGEAQNTAGNLYGYASMALGFNKPGPLTVIPAYQYLGAGGTAVTDSGSTYPQVSRASAAGVVVVITPGSSTPPLGRYGYWVRMRADTGTTYTVNGGSNTNGGLNTVTVTGAATYAWYYLGESISSVTNDGIYIATSTRPVGTGNLYIDRVVMVPTERRTAGNIVLDGARDQAAMHLYSNLGVPELVSR